jgi:hypothetical protein
MSSFSEPPSRKLNGSSKEENTIREIFYQHWEKINNKMDKASRDINSWRHKSIDLINKYADQQIRILTDDYNRQRVVFDENRRTNIDTAATYISHPAKQSDPFVQLRNACSKLEFQVSELEIIKDGMDYIKVMTVDDQKKKKQEGSMTNESTKIDDNMHINVNLSSSPASINSDRMK